MPKNKRNNKGNASAANGAVLQKMMQLMSNMKVQPQAAKSRRPRRRRPKPSAVNMEGMITLTRKELLGSLKTGTNGDVTSTFELKPASFKFLKNLGSSFERSRWLKLSVAYKPAVSVTSAGLIAMGVDWDGTTTATTRETIAAYTPSATFAIWQDTEKSPMTLPPSRLQSRAWYVHNAAQEWGPGKLVVNATGAASTDIGEIYVTYTIQMMGTRA